MRSFSLRRSPPLGSASARASAQPQLLDGRMAWPPAKRNVYTNTHNCSVRGHGELTILRRGALVRCCDFSGTGARCSSGKRGGGLEDEEGCRMGPRDLHLVAMFEIKTQTDTSFVIGPRWTHFTGAVCSVRHNKVSHSLLV